MENERWRNIVGWECCYQVSNLGNIRSKDRYVKANVNGVKLLKGQPIKLRYDRDGYLIVHLRDKSTNRNKMAKVHRLVAEAFLDKIEGKPIVDHINSVRDDNRADNLRYCTCKENNSYPLARLHNSLAVKESYNNIEGLRNLRARTFAVTSNSIAIKVFKKGLLIGVFKSVQKASNELGIKSRRIYACLKSVSCMVDEYVFERV